MMQYNTFGKTGLNMPVFSCGLMRSRYSAHDEGIIVPDQAQHSLALIVKTALGHGITHLETARNYGTSERQLAPILQKYKRDSFILQTKVRPEDDPEVFSTNVLDSLARLGQKRVDLLALHGINDHRSLWQVCRPGGCLAAARRLQEQGRADWIGFSGHGDVETICKAVEHQEDGGFDYLNLHWYTVYQRNTPALAAAAERDMGVFVISPTDKGGMLQKPPEKLVKICSLLSPIQFNDLFCLQRSEIHTVSVGAACPADFDEHLRVLPLLDSCALIQKIYRKWEKQMEKATSFSRPDALWSVLPDWHQTPGYINTGLIFWLYNLARGWDLLEFARRRYSQLGRDMPWVPGNNAAAACTYDLSNIAEKAGLSLNELRGMLKKAHSLLGEAERNV